MDNDSVFKKLINEKHLETSNNGDKEVTVDEIGTFEVLTDGRTYMVLKTIGVPIRSLYLSASGSLKGLMKFMRYIFNTQSLTNDKESNNAINIILDDAGDEYGSPLTLVQQILKGLKK